MIRRFITKFICKFKDPKTDTPISKNNEEGGSIQRDIKTHFKVIIIVSWTRGTGWRPKVGAEHVIYGARGAIAH